MNIPNYRSSKETVGHGNLLVQYHSLFSTRCGYLSLFTTSTFPNLMFKNGSTESIVHNEETQELVIISRICSTKFHAVLEFHSDNSVSLSEHIEKREKDLFDDFKLDIPNHVDSERIK